MSETQPLNDKEFWKMHDEHAPCALDYEGGEREPMKLTSENVSAVFSDCLFRDAELPNGAKPKEGEFTVGEGVRHRIGFHTERLLSHKQDVVDMLDCLADNFKQTKGGGWSFLQMCADKHDNQWTGDHAQVDKLVTLGAALDLISLTPVEMNRFLPGGVPYICIKE